MLLWNQFWNDERGAVLSAEVVLVGTTVVLGSVVGLNVVANAVNDELKEFAYAIRSLDQSYAFLGHRSCCAWTAGSYYRQPDVRQALAELCGEGVPDLASIQSSIDAEREAPPLAPIQPAKEPTPNQLPPAI